MANRNSNRINGPDSKRFSMGGRQSENHYSALFNSMDEGFFLIDMIFDENNRPVDMFYVEANAAATKMLGRDYTGKRLTEISPNYEPYWFEIFGGVALTGQSVRMERYAEPDEKWYSFHVFKVGDPESRRVGNTFQDITERKRLEQKIVHLASFPQLNPNPVIEVDLGGNISYLNPAAETMFHPRTPISLNEWAVDFDSLVTTLRKNGEPISTEVQVGGSWYQCVAHYVKEVWRIRFYWHDMTERKKAEEALRAMQAQVQMVTDTMEAGVTFCSRDLRYLWVSRALANWLGHEPDAIIGRSIVDVIGAPAYETIQPYVEEVLAGKRVEYETQIDYRGLGLRWIAAIYVPTRDANATVDGWVAMINDITARKRTEEALRDRELRLRLAQGHGHIGVWDWYPATGLDNFCDEMNGIYGLPAGTIRTYEDWLSRVYPDDVEQMIAERDAAIAKHESFDLAFRILHGSGDIRWICARGGAEYDAEGRVTCVMGVNFDITDRKRVEEELRKREQQYRELVQHANSAIMRWKPDGRLAFFNEFAQKFFGYEEGEVIGQRADILLPERESTGRDLTALLEDITNNPDRYATNVNENVRKDGSRVWMAWTNKPIFDENGNIVEILAVGGDITDRKRMEEELRKSRDDLDVRVRERTAELQQSNNQLQKEMEERARLEEQLRQVHKMEAIGTLAGGIAHDFNNMLAVIMGNAEIALEDISKDGPRQQIEQILKASKRSRELVRQILTFSRKSVAESKRVNMVPLLKETYQLLRSTLPTTIEMVLNIRTKADTAIIGDPSEVEQVVLNLANNAVFAMRDKGGMLTIGLSTVTLTSDYDVSLRPGRYVKLMMKDSGSGITPDVRRRMFDPFFTTKRQGEGTGMGLAVVYGIVRSLNGLIEAESEPGKGSIFTVLLPLSDVPTIEEDKEEASSKPGEGHILFIDDEPSVTAMTRSMLERMGYRVTAFNDASEALETFADNPLQYDLIITDQTMPGMTGVALAKAVFEIREGMPIILCTGYSEAVSPETAKEVGIREFVMKPVTKKEMGKAIHRVLAQEKGAK